MSRNPVPLLAPEASTQDLRAQVIFKEPRATELRKLAAEYQMEPAVLVRLLVVDGLNSRHRFGN